jgi:predicted glycogen debranching enzyme
LVAAEPPTHRYVLVNGIEAWVQTPAGRFAISSQLYAGEVLEPDGARWLQGFRPDPWPRWTFRLEDGTEIEQDVLVSRESGETLLTWRSDRAAGGVTLEVRPLLSGRDYHALHHENPAFSFEPEASGNARLWRPYPGVPAIGIASNGTYSHDPRWYRRFLYTQERARGLDDTEDLAAPGVFRFDLASGEAVLLLRAGDRPEGEPVARAQAIRESESRRRSPLAPLLLRSAEDYLVRRGDGRTVLAGYPWFTDWGRDAFIALRGLCLATGRLAEARQVLLSWTATLSEGMLPNRFPDRGEAPEYNSVDASLWFIVAVHDLITASNRSRAQLAAGERKTLLAAVEEIVAAYAKGTRYGIRADRDGLLAAGEPGLALTWMDAVVGGRAVTPRIGKPVEVQALWINALKIAGSASPSWGDLRDRALASFRERFWNESESALYDVVDCEHVPGRDDASFRPNQILSVGGLPFAVLSGRRAVAVVESVERRLLTPMGLRTLSPDDARYAGRYAGDARERDASYHQGTVWPWLLGPFCEAWVRIRGGGAAVRREARRLFLEPLLARVGEPGTGHLPELYDGDEPHAPGGCPFQAWSLAEALRLDRDVLAERRSGRGRREASAEREIGA